MRARRGAALVEMAFALLILTPVIAAGLGWAQAWMILAELETACREGARFAATYPVHTTPPDQVRAAVAERVRMLAPRLRDEQIVTETGYQSGQPREVRVSIRRFKLRAPGATWDLDGRPSALFPWTGPANVNTRTAPGTGPAAR